MLKKSLMIGFAAVAVLAVLLTPTNLTASSHAGATVLNSGNGQPDGTCFVGGFITTQMSAVRTPNGNGSLSCSFTGLPFGKVNVKGFLCFLNLDGVSFTTDSHFVSTGSGKGHLTCQFH